MNRDEECEAVLGHLYAYLDQEAGPDEAARIKAHLSGCPPCDQQLALENAFKSLIRRSCCCEPAPATLRARIITTITTIRVETPERSG